MRFVLPVALTVAILTSTAASSAAGAREIAVVERLDESVAELRREDASAVAIWLSDDTVLGAGDRLVQPQTTATTVRLQMPASQRAYVILQDGKGGTTIAAERRLPLQQASNFRDIGGYLTQDGRMVRWGKAFRSGAMPLLTENDYSLIGKLDLDSVVDFRSLEERSINADQVDDRTGAMFLSNDYSMQVLMAGMMSGGGENVYRGLEKKLVPQYRALFRRILADEGAVLYHCSAGQDRTGVATALIYDVLGVDRETILKDYHVSTQWRQMEWEMPDIDPADHPDNPIVQYYAASGGKKHLKPEPLYSVSGKSHLAQFFEYLDAEYGGTEAYLKQQLGLSDEDITRLRAIMLY